jgi:hypothetical protein
VFNPMLSAPVSYRVGEQFAIVTDDNSEMFTTLILNHSVPELQCLSCLIFTPKGDGPHIT